MKLMKKPSPSREEKTQAESMAAAKLLLCASVSYYCTSITADMTSAGIYEKLKVSISGIRRPTLV